MNKSSSFIIPADASSAEPQKIEILNWAGQYGYKPEVSFLAWHTGDVLHLKFEVREETVRAEEGVDGNLVYMDSCVEFFFQPDPADPHYYNFEFNAAGTLYLAYRTSRFDPELAPAEVLASVKKHPSLGKKTFAERSDVPVWTLEAEIPVSALWHHSYKTWAGIEGRANFYKCGDGLKTPHFVTWAPITTPSPDYHRPEFFVPISFEQNT